MRYFLSVNFNIASMGEKLLAQGIVILDFTVKTNIWLERDGQANLCVITETIFMQFYNLHNKSMI